MAPTPRRGRMLAGVALVLLLGGTASWLALRGPRSGRPAAGTEPAEETTAAPARTAERRHARERRERERAAPAGTAPAREPRVPPTEDAPEARTHDVPTATGTPVTVTVLDAGGAAVRGAHVTATSLFGSLDVEPDDAVTNVAGEATLRISGAIAFSPRAWTENAIALGERQSLTSTEPMEVTLTLQPAQRTAALVLSDHDAPLAGATITLMAPDGGPFSTIARRVTGEDGRADLGLVPDSVLESERAYVFAEAPRHVRQSVLLADALDPDGTVVVRLPRGRTVRGRCVRTGAAPVAGVDVVLAPGSRTRTGDDGRFEMGDVPATGGLLVMLPRELAPPAPIPVPEGLGDIDVGDVLLTAGEPVAGDVVDDLGRPVPGARVAATLQEARLRVRTAQADDRGRFTLPHLGPGLHRIQASAPAGGDWSARANGVLENVGAGTSGVRIVLTGGLSLVVAFKRARDGETVTVASAEVRTERTDTGGPMGAMMWSGSKMSSVRVSFDEPGSYRVTVTVPGYLPAVLEDVLIAEDRATKLDALLEE